jgi:hypothetical protein
MVKMAGVYAPNELLNFCIYMPNQLNASPIISIIRGFYHDGELTSAKADLRKFYRALLQSAYKEYHL